MTMPACGRTEGSEKPGNPWARMHLAHFRSCASTRACWAALSALDRREQVLAGAHRRIGLGPRVLAGPGPGEAALGQGIGPVRHAVRAHAVGEGNQFLVNRWPARAGRATTPAAGSRQQRDTHQRARRGRAAGNAAIHHLSPFPHRRAGAAGSGRASRACVDACLRRCGTNVLEPCAGRHKRVTEALRGITWRRWHWASPGLGPPLFTSPRRLTSGSPVRVTARRALPAAPFR